MSEDFTSPSYFINRELSWIDFNARVLEEARDPNNPLLERVKFLAIVANNLDEFFEVRVAGLLQLRQGGSITSDPDKISPENLLEQIAEKAHKQVEDQYECWNAELLPALASENIHLLEERTLKEKHLEFITHYWREELEPILTPIAVDPAHPFPHVINKALCIGALLQSDGQDMLGVVTVPRVLPRILRLPDDGNGVNFVTLADIMDTLIKELFSGHRVLASAAFRVTRNSELYVNEEEADNLMEEIAEQLKNQLKGDSVRLEIASDAPNRLVSLLQRQLHLDDDQIYRANGPVNLNRVMNLYDEVPRSDLKYKPFAPLVRDLPRDPDPFFDSLRHKDILLHHPYESFDTVIDFIKMAAKDPKVLAIKQTLYRTGDDSQVAQALIDAAGKGKEVTILVELKARGDEAANIEWAKRLEDSGVHVIYGVMGLKTHCKLSMLVRRDFDRLRRYVHMGTGNYNHTTARFYTDLGLITARLDVTEEVADVFNLLTTHSPNASFKNLMVAPSNLLRGTRDRIQREIDFSNAGKPAAIIAKMNGLMDPEIIRDLYRASQAGVQIDLIVRGICCLRPGLPGISENIRVYSIIGRFLEHSRLFYFVNGGDMEIWMGSADWMNRNLRGRVEVVFPVEDEDLKRRAFRELVELCLSDRLKCRKLNTDGTYTRRVARNGEPLISAHEALMQIVQGQQPVFPIAGAKAGNGQTTNPRSTASR